jgi:hypothetical protein
MWINILQHNLLIFTIIFFNFWTQLLKLLFNLNKVVISILQLIMNSHGKHKFCLLFETYWNQNLLNFNQLCFNANNVTLQVINMICKNYKPLKKIKKCSQCHKPNATLKILQASKPNILENAKTSTFDILWLNLKKYLQHSRLDCALPFLCEE